MARKPVSNNSGCVLSGTAVVRVLVVEDFGPFLQFIRSTLEERHDLQVIGKVSDGLEAVREAVELEPDLILMDIRTAIAKWNRGRSTNSQAGSEIQNNLLESRKLR